MGTMKDLKTYYEELAKNTLTEFVDKNMLRCSFVISRICNLINWVLE